MVYCVFHVLTFGPFYFFYTEVWSDGSQHYLSLVERFDFKSYPLLWVQFCHGYHL